MAIERNPNDPYRSPDDPYRSNLTDDDIRRQARLDSELQPDPELAAGPASGGKVAMFAIAIALVLGAVFYGLNSSSINQAGTSSTVQNTPPGDDHGRRSGASADAAASGRESAGGQRAAEVTAEERAVRNRQRSRLDRPAALSSVSAT